MQWCAAEISSVCSLMGRVRGKPLVNNILNTTNFSEANHPNTQQRFLDMVHVNYPTFGDGSDRHDLLVQTQRLRVQDFDAELPVK